ncbi:uncharacterized protein BKA78DRAFT_366725 [Phyllosticta capitalensis]|uniref:uncharacterized protein n=1 Tax=Phyllosticta capitalensis TaxID=121624 RepID=UPI00312F1E9F
MSTDDCQIMDAGQVDTGSIVRRSLEVGVYQPDQFVRRFELSSTGDVLLICHGGYQLRVQAAILRNASETFRAMLGPHFNEGRKLNCETPKEIPLPDDHPEAMHLLCSMLHHLHDPHDTPSPQLLKELATVVDKYFCVTYTQDTTNKWLETTLDQSENWTFKQLVEFLQTSYLLRSESAFYKTSKKMVHKYSTNLVFDFDDEMEQMPWKTIGTAISAFFRSTLLGFANLMLLVAIAEYKNLLEQELYDRVRIAVNHFLNKYRSRSTGGSDCQSQKRCFSLVSAILENLRPLVLPIQGNSLEEYFRYLTGVEPLELDTEDRESLLSQHMRSTNAYHQMCDLCRWNFEDYLEMSMDTAQKDFQREIDSRSGLCLWCTIESPRLMSSCPNGMHHKSRKRHRAGSTENQDPDS